MTTPQYFERAQQAGNKFAPVIQQMSDTSQLDHIFAQVGQSGNPADFDKMMMQIASNVSPQNQGAALKILQNKKNEFLENQKYHNPKNIENYKKFGLSNEESEGLINLPKDQQNSAFQTLLKVKKDKAELAKANKEKLNYAFDRTIQLLEGGNTGKFTFGHLTPEGRQDRAELSNLSEIFVANLIPIINPRGTLSKPRFEYIKNLTPQENDTDATIKGKLKALKEIFSLKGNAPALKNMPKEENITETINIQEGQTASGPNGKVIFKGGQWQQA